MFLADSSVWIDYLKGINSPQTDLLNQGIYKNDIVLGDLIALEVLQCVRDDSQFESVKDLCRGSTPTPCSIPMPRLRRQTTIDFYAKKGITIRKTNDVIIASFCIAAKIPLLFQDRDFSPFVRHLGLQAVYLEA